MAAADGAALMWLLTLPADKKVEPQAAPRTGCTTPSRDVRKLSVKPFRKLRPDGNCRKPVAKVTERHHTPRRVTKTLETRVHAAHGAEL